MKRLRVVLFAGPVHRAAAEVAILPFPEDERPLRGDAGIVDWRLGGKISELTGSGFCTGRFGEAILIPGGRGLAAERVLLFGVGSLDTLHGRGAVQAFTLAAGRLVSIRARRAVVALPDGLPLDRIARALLLGLARAITVPSGASELALVIPDGEGRGTALRRVWQEASADLAGFGVEGILEDPSVFEAPLEEAAR